VSALVTISPQDWLRMPWHARADAVRRARQELAAIEAWLIEERMTVGEARLVGEQARAILARLPQDPQDAQHRADLWQATRKDRTA